MPISAALAHPRRPPRPQLAALAVIVLLAHALLLGTWSPKPTSDGRAVLQVRQIVLAAPPTTLDAPEAPQASAAAPTGEPSPWPTGPTATPTATPTGEARPAAPPPRRHTPAPRSDPMPAPAAPTDTATPAAADPLTETEPPAAAATATAEATLTAPPAPTYATDLPPAALLHYTLQRGGREGEATLRWQRDGARYELEMSGRIAGLERFGWASRGGFDAGGLAPERFVVRRRGRDAAAVNFDRDAASALAPTIAPAITFSGPGFALPQPAGVQDRVSWLLQLAAIARALPQPVAPGTTVVMPVVGPRGDLAAWRFVAGTPEPLALPAGAVTAAQPWQRAAERARDLEVQVWLDPARGQLPVRLRLEARPDGGSTEWRLAALQPG